MSKHQSTTHFLTIFYQLLKRHSIDGFPPSFRSPEYYKKEFHYSSKSHCSLFLKLQMNWTSTKVVVKYNTFYIYLIEPVRVENPKTAQFASSTLLCNRALAALEFQLCDTLVCGFAIHNTLRNWSLPSATSYTYTIYHITLLRILPVTKYRAQQVNYKYIIKVSIAIATAA